MKEVLKLVIVDDEDYVIDGLRKHIDWEKLGIEIAGTASNGTEGIEQVTRIKPDMVLADIRMPEMDGISMIERLNETGVTPLFMIFSGYGDFDYTRHAIRFGVVDYILKPSLPEEITQALGRTAEKCRRIKRITAEQERLHEQFEDFMPLLQSSFIAELLHGKIASPTQFRQKCEFLSLNLAEKGYRVASLAVDGADGIFSQYTEAQKQYILYMIASSSAQSFGVGKAFTGFSDSIAHFLLSGSDEELEENAVAEKSDKIIDFCGQKYGVSVTIGISPIVRGFDAIAEAYELSMESVKYCIEGNRTIFHTESLRERETLKPERLYNKEMLIEAIRVGDESLVMSCVSQFFANVRKLRESKEYFITPILYEMIGATALTFLQMGVDYGYNELMSITKPNITLHEIERRLNSYYADMMRRVNEDRVLKSAQVVQKIIAIVKSRYSEGITLNEIADSLYLTPNYLSTLFSTNMGQSFSSYVTHYRVEKAKELLESGKYKVYEIGGMVGYKDPEYFSKVFKEIVGVLPSSYRK